jgi:aspartyl-tRNA(Asn)/glutamyl-tRNA(Gln) amidotransferase subunit A
MTLPEPAEGLSRPPLWQLGATQLVAGYRDGRFTPLQALQACLQRNAQCNPQLNALVTLDEAGATRAAQESTARWQAGRPLGLLDGVPVTIKDNLHVCGLTTTWGSRGLAGLVADQDELAVARLRTAGTIIIGKTNVPEFTLEGYTSNPVFGITRNPWNLALTPGGSSGGAVASVAAGIAPLALGTDGGGSTRRPAAHCGLVGFKPSIGAIARTATLPSLLLDFEVVGTMARTMADTQLLFDAVRGPDPADRASLAAAQGALACVAPGRALRILYVERFGNAPLDPQIAASVRASVQQFAALGHQVDEGALPLDLEFFNDAWPQVGQIGLAAMFRAQPAWREGASPKYREMAAQGEKLPATRLWLILAQVQSLRRAAAALFEGIDVVVTPATAALPWSADEAYPPQIEGRLAGPRGHAIYTGWVNAAGLPGLALPCAPSREGLPIGLQLVGAYGADQQLLTLGTSFEVAAPWSGRWPVSQSF